MSKYRKFAVCFIVLQIVLFIVINIWGNKAASKKQGKQYKVDISRIVTRIENGEDYATMNLDEYENILAVSPFDDSVKYKNEYEIRRINDVLYCFEYQDSHADSPIVILNVFVMVVILSNIVLLIYLDRKMMTPFSRMDNLTVELAKGNLATPIKQEKSKYFGKFLWGMDMLRETLEDNKKREYELLKEKKTLILSLSHDIKTPLSAIDLYTKALRKDLFDSEEEKTAAFDGITHNVEEIKRYVKEITLASRDDFLSLEANNTELYLSQIIQSVKQYYEEKMKRLHIDFSVADVENCLIYGDADRLIEVLQNTIENAIKYGDGKQMNITFDEEEDCKLISVTNTGCTLGKEELPHIFDSFYRGTNSEKEEGSGLGLYICKELMHRMDGEIFAQIDDGKYTVTIVVRKL